MIGIGTPMSQRSNPRPMSFSFAFARESYDRESARFDTLPIDDRNGGYVDGPATPSAGLQVRRRQSVRGDNIRGRARFHRRKHSPRAGIARNRSCHRALRLQDAEWIACFIGL